MDNFPEAMRFIWKGWPEPVKAGAGAPPVRDILVADENWRLVADNLSDARGPASNSKGEVLFADVGANKILRLGRDGKISTFVNDAEQANAVAIGPQDEVITVSEVTGKVLCYDESGVRRVVAEHLPGRYVVARPDGSLYVSGCSSRGSQLPIGNRVWHVKDGKTLTVAMGIKRPTGLAYRPDQWLLAVADGDSRWAYSYQINNDGSLTNQERFFWLHVADSDDDAGTESVSYAREGQILFATRSGIQICADDGPAQVILPMPDRSRVSGICLGAPEHNTLFAFCGNKIWKRTVKLHAIGAFSPWQKVQGTPL
jgi:sugar lactone lactonase YvrE